MTLTKCKVLFRCPTSGFTLACNYYSKVNWTIIVDILILGLFLLQTAPQDAHMRLVLQVYLGSNILEFSANVRTLFGTNLLQNALACGM